MATPVVSPVPVPIPISAYPAYPQGPRPLPEPQLWIPPPPQYHCHYYHPYNQYYQYGGHPYTYQPQLYLLAPLRPYTYQPFQLPDLVAMGYQAQPAYIPIQPVPIHVPIQPHTYIPIHCQTPIPPNRGYIPIHMPQVQLQVQQVQAETAPQLQVQEEQQHAETARQQQVQEEFKGEHAPSVRELIKKMKSFRVAPNWVRYARIRMENDLGFRHIIQSLIQCGRGYASLTHFIKNHFNHTLYFGTH